MEHKIDEAPLPVSGRGTLWGRYPFEMMQPGQHTTINRSEAVHPIASIRAALSQHAIKSGKQFMTRMDKKTGHLHVWRIS